MKLDRHVMNEIRAPEEWKEKAKGLWVVEPQKNHRRKPLVVASVLCMCMVGVCTTVAFGDVIPHNQVQVYDSLEEMQEDNELLYEEYMMMVDEDDEEMRAELEAELARGQERILEHAEYYATEYWERTEGVSASMYVTKEEQDGDVRIRYLKDEDDLIKTIARVEYQAPLGSQLLAYGQGFVEMDLTWIEDRYTCCPYGNLYQVEKFSFGRGVSENLFLTYIDSEDETGLGYVEIVGGYFRAADRGSLGAGGSIVMTEDYDAIVEYTTTNGIPFTIMWKNGRADAESDFCINGDADFHLSVDAMGLDEAELEELLESLNLVVNDPW